MTVTHRMRGTRLYSIYRGMLWRCYSPKATNFDRYGARGIRVCDEWRNDCTAFFSWALSHGYADTLTIERDDTSGDYEPNNCRWATRLEQSNNRTSNRLFTYRGKTLNIAQWAKEFGLGRSLVYGRLKDGWSFERALTAPIRRRPRKDKAA